MFQFRIPILVLFVSMFMFQIKIIKINFESQRVFNCNAVFAVVIVCNLFHLKQDVDFKLKLQ